MDDVLSQLRDLATTHVERHVKARQAAELIRQARSYRWVGLYDVSASEIAAIAWTGTIAPAYPRFPVTKGLSGAAVATRQPVIVQDVTQDARYLTAFGGEEETFLRRCVEILAPLWIRAEVASDK